MSDDRVTHFICKDAILAFCPQIGEPVETRKLEWLEGSAIGFQVRRVLVDLDIGGTSVDTIRNGLCGQGRSSDSGMVFLDGGRRSLLDLVIG